MTRATAGILTKKTIGTRDGTAAHAKDALGRRARCEH